MAASNNRKPSIRISLIGDEVVIGANMRLKAWKVLIAMLVLAAPYLAQHFPSIYNFLRVLI